MNLKTLGVAFLVLAAGSDAAMAGGEGCCSKSGSVAKSALLDQADGLLARLLESNAAAVQLGEQEMAEMAKAKEVLGQICPVCRQMPDTSAFLSQAVGYAAHLEADCSAKCEANGAAMKALPAEVRTALAERGALLGRAKKLLAASFETMGSEDGEKGCSKLEAKAGAGESCCASGSKETAEGGTAKKCCGEGVDCLTALSKKAEKLLASWDGIPGQVAAMSADDRGRFQSAMAAMRKAAGGKCALFQEAIQTTARVVGRVVEIDSQVEKICGERKEMQGCPFQGTPLCPKSETFAGRKALLRKTADLLARMGKTLAPESSPIFTSQAQ